MGLSSFPTFSFLVETVIYFSFPMKLALYFPFVLETSFNPRHRDSPITEPA